MATPAIAGNYLAVYDRGVGEGVGRLGVGATTGGNFGGGSGAASTSVDGKVGERFEGRGWREGRWWRGTRKCFWRAGD